MEPIQKGTKTGPKPDPKTSTEQEINEKALGEAERPKGNGYGVRYAAGRLSRGKRLLLEKEPVVGLAERRAFHRIHHLDAPGRWEGSAGPSHGRAATVAGGRGGHHPQPPDVLCCSLCISCKNPWE